MGIGRDLRVGNLLRSQKSPAEWLYRTARVRTTTNPWYADPLARRLVADPVATLAAAAEQSAQQAVDAGLLLLLDGFTGCCGPEEYANECPPKTAVWVYGTNSRTPAMRTSFRLDALPATPARLALTAQDDDKPGRVAIRITVNDREVFSGPNAFAERGWSTAEFAIPDGVLKAGANELRIATLNESPAADAGWFMLAECQVLWK